MKRTILRQIKGIPLLRISKGLRVSCEFSTNLLLSKGFRVQQLQTMVLKPATDLALAKQSLI